MLVSSGYLVAVFEVKEALDEGYSGDFTESAHMPDFRGRLLIRLVEAEARALADG